jgi:hypothetical protein
MVKFGNQEMGLYHQINSHQAPSLSNLVDSPLLLEYHAAYCFIEPQTRTNGVILNTFNAVKNAILRIKYIKYFISVRINFNPYRVRQ